jgi:hypothetical protein
MGNDLVTIEPIEDVKAIVRRNVGLGDERFVNRVADGVQGRVGDVSAYVDFDEWHGWESLAAVDTLVRDHLRRFLNGYSC